MYRQLDRQIDKYIAMHIDSQIDKQVAKNIAMHIDRQIKRYMYIDRQI